MSEPTEPAETAPRDDPTEWEIHAALAALDRLSLTDAPWLRGADDYYWLRLEGNRAGYIQLARVLLRAASTRGVNLEYLAGEHANAEIAGLMVRSSQLSLRLSPHDEAPPPLGPVGARKFRIQLQHAAAVWGCGVVAFIGAMLLFFLLLYALGFLTD